MIKSNRWSWSAVTSQQPPVRPPDALGKVNKPADQKLQPGASSVSSRRLSKHRWSWRSDANVLITRKDQENEPGELKGQNRSLTEKPTKDSHRLPKHVETAETAAAPPPPPPPPPPLTTTTSIPPPPALIARLRPRPSSMIAAASASYGAAPSCSTSKKQQEGEEQPSAGVKNVLNRVLSRRLSSYNINKKSTPAAQAEPTPPPSRQQQQPPMQMQMPMQPSIRRRPQLHNPQNTLRATSTLVNNPQNQGDIDNGHVVAPLPGLDEDSQLQLPPTIRRPSTAPGVKVAALAKGTTSSSAGQPATEGTGLFGRLVRRRPAPKERDTENDKKRGSSASIGDNSNEPSGVDDQNRSSTDPVPVMNETTEHYQMQPQSLPLNPSAHRTLDAPSSAPRSETVSDAQTTSKSSVPRFLRQVAKPRQASVAMTQTATAQKSKSHSHLRPSQQPAPSSTTQPKLRPKRSFGKRFWSRPGANDFDDDHQVAKTEAPPLPSVPSVPPTVYVPKHAAVDFSRTINPRLNRQSLIVGDDQVNDLRPTTADTRVGESETQPRQRALASATIDKHMARDLSMSKYEAPSPMELHRRLEILKRREAEAVAKTRNPWQHQLNLLQTNANTSASNMKAPILKGPSRSISSRRHSFSLISDPHARELTPPRSASPAETEAPIDPPSQMPQQMVSAVAPGVTSSHDHTHQTRQDGPVKQAAARQMTDFERFLAEAEVAERERQAQMWRNLARRSGHYGYSDNPWNPVRPVDPSLIGTSAVNAAANRNNKRNSAQYTVDKRASMMSDFYGPLTGTYGSSGDDADATRGLGRQGSVSKRISQYIKPPKPSAQPTYEDWPTGRANRRSAIVGAIGE